jgi:hypothetical protein
MPTVEMPTVETVASAEGVASAEASAEAMAPAATSAHQDRWIACRTRRLS